MPPELRIGRAEFDDLRRNLADLRGNFEAVRQRLGDLDLVMALVGSERASRLATERRLDKVANHLEQASESVGRLNESVGQLGVTLDGVKGDFSEEIEALRRRAEAQERALESQRERQEFIRTETLFELRNALSRNNSATMPQWRSDNESARILNRERFDTLSEHGRLKLNVGCGHVPMDDYLNVDMRELPHIDVLADAGKLPFSEQSVDEIFSSHLLEHFPREYLKGVLLPHWVSLLRPEGRIVAIVPDPEAMISDYKDGIMPWSDLREVLYGLQEYEGDFHFSLYDKGDIEEIFKEVGLGKVIWEFDSRKNGKCRDMKLVGMKS